MLDVNEALTRHVANLSRLELSDSEIKTFTSQLEQIIHYVDQLQKVNVEGVPPLTHPLTLETPMREDVVKPSPKDVDGKPKVLKHAPDVLHGGFKVPQIL